MKDKVIKFNNEKYYVIDELLYKDRSFIFCAECDSTGDDITGNYSVLEVKFSGNDLVVDNINDFEIASVVNNLFLAKLNTEEEIA